MNDEFYISPFKIRKRFDITSNTLRTWADKGDIRCIRIRDGQGKRLYHIEDIEKIFKGSESTAVIRETICYARVSSNHQKEDLDRQIKFLSDSFPSKKIFSDIGSGLNFKRKKFKALLELIHQGKVEKVVVTYKDRLCRFGIELLEWIFEKSRTELVVLNKISNQKSDSTESELAEDLLAITTVFVAKNNGLRAAKYRRERKEREQSSESQESSESSEE